MSEVDWSKAPEWADGHGLVAHHGITEVWINMDQYAVIGAEDRAYPYGGGTGEARHNFTRSQVQYITPRPGQWDGTGLPPVGAVCERRFHDNEGSSWQRVTITAHGHKKIMCLEETGDEWAHFGLEVSFRPARTPEQIAADERLHKVRNAHTAIARTLESLWGDIPAETVSQQVIEAMIDAGYSKQVAP